MDGNLYVYCDDRGRVIIMSLGKGKVVPLLNEVLRHESVPVVEV